MLLSRGVLLIVCFVTGLLHRGLAVAVQNSLDTQTASSWQNLSASLNASSNGTNDLTFTLKYLVFPQVPDTVAVIQDVLRAYVHSGTVERFESHLRPSFDGVEFWIVYATVAEILAVGRSLENDVSNSLRTSVGFSTIVRRTRRLKIS